MPIEPKSGETKNDFISRCIEQEITEGGYDKDQAAAICYSKWRSAKKNEVLGKIKRLKKSLYPVLQKCRDHIRDEIRSEMESTGNVVLSSEQMNRLAKSLEMETKDLAQYVNQVRKSIEKEKRPETSRLVKKQLESSSELTDEEKKRLANDVGVTVKEIDRVIYQLGEKLKGEPEEESSGEEQESGDSE